jgi:hypothetical protein
LRTPEVLPFTKTVKESETRAATVLPDAAEDKSASYEGCDEYPFRRSARSCEMVMFSFIVMP